MRTGSRCPAGAGLKSSRAFSFLFAPRAPLEARPMVLRERRLRRYAGVEAGERRERSAARSGSPDKSRACSSVSTRMTESCSGRRRSVACSMLFVSSGYGSFGLMPGNALLAFRAADRGKRFVLLSLGKLSECHILVALAVRKLSHGCLGKTGIAMSARLRRPGTAFPGAAASLAYRFD